MEYWLVRCGDSWFCIRVGNGNAPYLSIEKQWIEKATVDIYFNSRRWLISVLKELHPRIKQIKSLNYKEIWKSG